MHASSRPIKTRLRGGAILAAVAAAAVLFSTPAYGASLSGKVIALPNPPEAPARNVFVVTFPHHRVHPVEAVFRFLPSTGARETQSASLDKVNRYEYETAWEAPAEGRLTVDIYGQHHVLLAAAQYRVVRAKGDIVSRVVIGGLFIAVSLWFWRRQQRFYRDPRR
ncbi:MAG: hypothetical protein OWU84_09540 [Firmicutes bacterium]|nr:hypothetical protein [Bacillota bacterium]